MRLDPEKNSTKLKVCKFEKHQGELWVDIIEEDRAYVEWLVEQQWLNDDLHDYLIGLLEDN